MNAKVCAMREIILINSTPFPTIPTLIVNTIHYLPLYKALLEVGINPQCPKDTINALIFTSKHAIKALLQELQTHRDMLDFSKILKSVVNFQINPKDSSFCNRFWHCVYA